MNSTDFQTGSLQKMDPTAVFVHHDRKCQTLADRTWQKLNIDRVSQCSFDSSGRFCAVHYSYNAIEIWDFTSIPVPITTLLVPKIASGRGDGFCYNLTWSPCNTFLIGVFGSKFVNQRKAEGSTSEDTTTTKVYRPYQLVVWNVKQRVLTHAVRLVNTHMLLSASNLTSHLYSLYLFSQASIRCKEHPPSVCSTH